MELRKTDSTIVAVLTARKIFEGYTKQQVKKVKLARELQEMAVHPTDLKYKDMVRNKPLPNCPITTYDTTNASSMFGPDLPGVRGKTSIKIPRKVDTE